MLCKCSKGWWSLLWNVYCMSTPGCQLPFIYLRNPALILFLILDLFFLQICDFTTYQLSKYPSQVLKVAWKIPFWHDDFKTLILSVGEHSVIARKSVIIHKGIHGKFPAKIVFVCWNSFSTNSKLVSLFFNVSIVCASFKVYQKCTFFVYLFQTIGVLYLRTLQFMSSPGS